MKIVMIMLFSLVLALFAYIGYKKGVFKQLISFVLFVLMTITAYKLRVFPASLCIKYLPFFNFGGAYNKVYSLNILIYQIISFIVILVLIYCIIYIIIGLTGISEYLTKKQLSFDLISKLFGLLFGLFEGFIVSFVISVCLLQFPMTQSLIMNNKVLKGMVEKTPIVSRVFSSTIVSSQEFYFVSQDKAMSPEEKNLEMIRKLIRYEIISARTVQINIDNGKLRLDNVTVSSS